MKSFVVIVTILILFLLYLDTTGRLKNIVTIIKTNYTSPPTATIIGGDGKGNTSVGGVWGAITEGAIQSGAVK